MRAIDADALEPDADYYEGDYWAVSIVQIHNAPTIEPRKKGKWIDRGWSGDGRGNAWHEWECSECKHITKGAKWDFCPNCGAEMQRGAV